MYKPLFLFFLILASCLGADNLPWNTNFQKAQKEAAAAKKPLFLYFTGSDWCKECTAFQSCVLESEDFVATLKDIFVFALIDFPMEHKQPVEVTAANKELKERFKIVGLPTIAILLPSQNAILMAAPSSISPQRLAAILLAETDAALTLETIMVSFRPEQFSSDQLISLYQAARLVSRKDWQEQILNAGLKRRGTDSFFLREKYRLLIQQGKKNSPEAQKIRSLLLESDPNNELGHQLYVAVSDFETNVQSHDLKKDASEPLVSFLKRFNQTSASWKVKAMLASYYMSTKRYNEAKHYLQEALKEAPTLEQDKLKGLLRKLP